MLIAVAVMPSRAAGTEAISPARAENAGVDPDYAEVFERLRSAEARGIKLDVTLLPEAWHHDVPPVPGFAISPVYPYGLLREQVAGSARVAAIVDERGRLQRVEVLSADHPEFGLALVAAIEATLFSPARKRRARVPGVAIHEFRFDPKRLPNSKESSVWRIETTAPEKIVSAANLDVPPRPRYQAVPRYPLNPREPGSAGRASIEIVIDQEGYARLPRVISATSEEFGFAAAQAVSKWWFFPALKGGKAVHTRAVIPIVFVPQARTEP